MIEKEREAVYFCQYENHALFPKGGSCGAVDEPIKTATCNPTNKKEPSYDATHAFENFATS